MSSSTSNNNTNNITKKPQPKIVEQSASVPPRYQPPPLPPILKKDPLLLISNNTNTTNPTITATKCNGNRPMNKNPVVPPPTRPPLIDEPGLPYRPPPSSSNSTGGPSQVRYDDEFLRPEMLKFVRKTGNGTDCPDGIVLSSNQPRLFNDLRTLREANQRLAEDNQELRDLCCFLDDDRQKGRKLAREWQRFGRYTASVMRQEVSTYQSKLRELDNKQQELIKDNLELKELCLYLDEERNGTSNNSNTIPVLCSACGGNNSTNGTSSNTNNNNGNLRDEGDGSSSSTNADEPAVPQQFTTGPNGTNCTTSTNPNRSRTRSASRERILNENVTRQRSTFNDQIMQYVRSLEQRVKQLEDDKRNLTHKINQIVSTGSMDPNHINSEIPNCGIGQLSGRPEAVVRALQVLEVREQLERETDGSTTRRTVPPPIPQQDNTANIMDEGEKALVREMCNVVWRKLEEGPVRR